MANSTANIRNYIKLDLMIVRSCVLMRQIFRNRYSLFNPGQQWNDSTKCGTRYIVSIRGNSKKINLTSSQQLLISQGDPNKWDVTTLTALLLYTDRPKTLNQVQIAEFDVQDALLLKLRDIRNTLAHHPSKSISDSEFHQLWSALESILIGLGDAKTELDKLKNDPMLDANVRPINEEARKQLIHFNTLGARAHKEQRYLDAIAFFIQASILADVPDEDRALVYSNMSASRLALSDQQNPDSTEQQEFALQDAKQARMLCPASWQGHFRVGKLYAALNEHEKAIRSLERALAIDPVNKKIQDALDDSRQIHSRQVRHEHLDPRLKPRTMDELFKDLETERGIDPGQVRLSHTLLEALCPAQADVVKGHKFFHGDAGIKQDYEQAAKYFGKAASQGIAEGMYNLALMTDRGLGVKKDHQFALKLLEQAASQPPEHSKLQGIRNIGVAEAEHSLGLRYAEGIVVHKNLAMAAQWYQRAVNHGSAQAANNLAIMYEEGAGVERDLNKAKELFELSARRGDPNAMKSLAENCLDSNDLHMAKLWYDRACQAGHVRAQTGRDDFELLLRKRQQLIDQCSPDQLQILKKISLVGQSNNSSSAISKMSSTSFVRDLHVLSERAKCGSQTAEKMCQAINHFNAAMELVMSNDKLTLEQENKFIEELAMCYRLEHIVAQIPGTEVYCKVEDIINRVLERCVSQSDGANSQVDEDVRTCYAVLHMDSFESTLAFLGPCKKKYPKSIYFWEMSAALHCWLKSYDAALYDTNTGLQINPNYEELLYSKAAAMKLSEKDPSATIATYQAFIAITPKDHRKMPESYYSIASCYLLDKHRTCSDDYIEQIYKQGEEAEKIQLPCFLPYKSNTKTFLKLKFDKISTTDVLSTASVTVNRKHRLNDPKRIEIITGHRRWTAQFVQMQNLPGNETVFHTQQPRVKQSKAKSLIGLKAIALRDIDPTKDHVYHDYVLSVTIVEDALSWNPSIHLVVEDENVDCEQLVVYGFPPKDGRRLITKVLTLGTKMQVISPYLRIGANDGKPFIRVDDFSSIIFQNESERVVNMCRCCHEPNALHRCSRCQKAQYCSKECQTMDWKLYQHKLLCCA